jgi:hypothetical protein
MTVPRDGRATFFTYKRESHPLFIADYKLDSPPINSQYVSFDPDCKRYEKSANFLDFLHPDSV